MGCIGSSTHPAKCRPIVVSTISASVKLTSTLYSGIHDSFEFIKILGHGQYGTVREAIRKPKVSSQKYAIKSIVKQCIPKHRLIMKRELEILMEVDHPNIIKLYETYEDELYLHLVMEICTGGDVCERLIKKASFSEIETANIMRQLMGAVNYLHIKGITHRDLKPENFLYLDEHSDEIKICDFGMSIKNDGNNRMRSIAGTPYYLAPEVHRGSYTKACDVWSLGVFMYFILVGKHPFKGGDLESIYQKSSKGASALKMDELGRISEGARDLIKKMLTVQIGKRISMKDALAHPWITNFQTKEIKIPQNVFKSLCKYKAKSKLWQEAIRIVVKNLSNPQINLLREVFISIDVSKTGFITAGELQDSMRINGFNLASEEIESIMRNCSYLQSGKINYSDFLVATLSKKALMNEEVMWEAFKIFDSNNKGRINLTDLNSALNKAGCEFTQQEFDELTTEAQIDDNSEVDYENFKILMSCFEEENEILSAKTRRMSLVRKMTKDFKVQILRARTLGKE